MSKKEIKYGSYKKEYTLIREKRKSMKLVVKPNMEIILTCPTGVTNEKIESFLHRKWQWLEKQASFFSKYQKKVYKKEYVSGESFFYLGKQYQLIVRKRKEDNVILSREKLIVETSQEKDKTEYVKLLLDLWYKENARIVFRERFDEMFDVFDYKNKILLRTAPLKRKWGSFKGYTVTLNPLLLQGPKEAIDYVITHELCHVKYKKHNKKFWDFMDKMYPGWEKVKEKLELKFG